MDKEVLRNRAANGKILIIDDEPVVRNVLMESLSYMGFSPLVARNGVEALEIFRSRKKEIDLVILDLVMRDRDGIEIFSEIKKMDNDVKIIVSSGYIDHERLKTLPKANFKGFIQKPYNIIRISQMICNALFSVNVL